MGGIEKGPKRSGRFSAEPETMVLAMGGAEKEKEATGAEKGLTAHKLGLPVGGAGAGRGGTEGVESQCESCYRLCSPGEMS